MLAVAVQLLAIIPRAGAALLHALPPTNAGTIRLKELILEAEHDSANRYKVSKQADVLMLFYLFSAEELRELFKRLGYAFAYETIPRNLAYYDCRSTHGSTLSRVAHAWVLARSDRKRAMRYYHSYRAGTRTGRCADSISHSRRAA